MWIFQFIVPLHQRAMLGVTAHQLDRFGNNVDGLRATESDPVLRLQPKDAFHLPPTLVIVPPMPLKSAIINGKLSASPTAIRIACVAIARSLNHSRCRPRS